jgi:hypothetical protein
VNAPLRGSGAEITGVISVSTDISVEVAAEAAGSHNRALLDTVLKAVPMLVASFDLEGRLVDGAGRLYESGTVQRLVGQRLDAVTGNSVGAAFVTRVALPGDAVVPTCQGDVAADLLGMADDRQPPGRVPSEFSLCHLGLLSV